MAVISGNYGKHNLRQYPVFVDTPVEQHTSARPVITSPDTDYGWELEGLEKAGRSHERAIQIRISDKKDQAILDRRRWLARIASNSYVPPRVAATGYEKMSSKTGFDILALSTLAALHTGRATRRAISTDPQRTPSQLIQQIQTQVQWSYLSFLPCRYGHVAYLNDAIDCVVARARNIICPSQTTEDVVIRAYVKAIRSLQKALDSQSTCASAEVLAATEILGLYEVNKFFF